MYVDLDQALVFLLVLLRMLGMLVTNPILGRRNIPPMVNAGLAFLLTVLLVTSTEFTVPVSSPSFPQLILMALKELAVGMIASYIILLILSVLIIGGEVIDMQMGLGMAKEYDPGTNSSISMSSTWFNYMFLLAFFATNNHLTFIRMVSQSFRIIPLGGYTINMDMMGYLPAFFSTIYLYAIKLALPIVVVEIIVTVAVGIVMRMVPQVNIFVLNIQFKIIIGMLSLLVLVGPLMAYFENLMIICFEQIAYVWSGLAV